MAGEIPHQQKKEHNDDEHEDSKDPALGGGAAHLYLACHTGLDATLEKNIRAPAKLKKTLPKSAKNT